MWFSEKQILSLITNILTTSKNHFKSIWLENILGKSSLPDKERGKMFASVSKLQPELNSGCLGLFSMSAELSNSDWRPGSPWRQSSSFERYKTLNLCQLLCKQIITMLWLSIQKQWLKDFYIEFKDLSKKIGINNYWHYL